MTYPINPSMSEQTPAAPLKLIATSAFGLEAVVVRELANLGYDVHVVRPGRIAFSGDFGAVVRTNLWLRSADRVLVELAAFEAADFDEGVVGPGPRRGERET